MLLLLAAWPQGSAGGASSGAVGMAAALDEELNMKEAAREAAAAQRRTARVKEKAATEEWLGAKPQGGTREAKLEAKVRCRWAAAAGPPRWAALGCRRSRLPEQRRLIPNFACRRRGARPPARERSPRTLCAW